MSRRRLLLGACVALSCLWLASRWLPAQGTNAPVIVVETSKGTFQFETYPADAPKTVAHIVDLVKQGFYDGQRFHRAQRGFVIQWGDPQSRDESKQQDWGRGAAASSGTPVGTAELSKKRIHTRGAVGVAHPGNPALADSQIFVTLDKRDELNGKYSVIGHVIAGMDVVDLIQRGDTIRRMYIKE
jgi:cyclophilin family peptidyl-prolyl cis-trans isomerase